MPAIRQRSFAAGEIAPSLWGRDDLPSHAHGLRLSRGFIVTPHGSALNRPGTPYLGPVKDHTKRSRLVTFNFGNDQNFILEFGDLYVRFWKDGGQVMNGAVPLEVVSPYLEADLRRLKFTQSGDVITITHRSYAPRTLVRNSNTSWTLSVIDYWNDPPPPFEGNGGIVGTLTSGARYQFAFTAVYGDGRESQPRFTAPVDFASSAIVSLFQVGTRNAQPIKYRYYRAQMSADAAAEYLTALDFEYIGESYPVPADQIPPYTGLDGVLTLTGDPSRHPPVFLNPFVGPPTAWAQSAAYKVGARVTANGNTYECIVSGRSSSVGAGPAGTNGDIWDGPAFVKRVKAYAVNDLISQFGTIVRCTTAGTTATYSDSIDWQPTGTWQDGTAWFTYAGTDLTKIESAVRWRFVQVGIAPSNWPACATHFEQRKVYANGLDAPGLVRASALADFDEFASGVPVLDDSALSLGLASLRYEEVRALVPLRALLACTNEAVWIISGSGGVGDVLTALSRRARVQNHRGIGWLDPLSIGHGAIVLSPAGNIVQEFVFDFQSDAYQGADLSLLSSHLLVDYTIEEWAFARTPFGVAWAVRDDGVLLGLTYVRELEVVAWHWHDTDGAFESVATVPEGLEDAVYVIVRRTIGGVTKRYVERFASRRVSDARLGVFLDSALTYDGRNTGAQGLGVWQHSGGWDAGTEVVILASPDGYFVPGDVGKTFVLDPDGTPVALLVTQFQDFPGTADQVVAVVQNGTVPAAFQGAYATNWGRAATQLSGLGHLEGKTVVALADGNVVRADAAAAPLVVTGGAITIPEPAVIVHVGLPYLSDLELLDLGGSADARGKEKIVSKVIVELEKSRGLQVGKDFDSLSRWNQRAVADGYGPVPLLTGRAEVLVSGEWAKTGRAVVRQADPLPCHVVAVTREVSIA